MPLDLGGGVLIREARNDNPTYCNEIGCVCIIRKRLEEARVGPRKVVYFCPSTRASATAIETALGTQFALGNYLGDA